MNLTPEILQAILQFGAAGVMAVITIKVLDLVTLFIKSRSAKEETIKVDHKKYPDDCPASEGLAQSKQNGKAISRIEKILVEGNGQPGLVTQVAVMSQQINAHVGDDRLHSN